MSQRNNSYVFIENSKELNEKLGFDIKKKSNIIFNFVLKKFRIKNSFYVDVNLVSNYKIKKINFEFRKINKSTDVLSFPNFNFKKPLEFIDLKKITEPIFFGDVIISIDKIFSQSKKFNHSVYREYCFLFLHSILHLLGFDHIKTSDEKVMFNLQNEILDTLGINR